MLEELIRRDGIHKAIAGRNENTIQPLLSFIIQYINYPKYTNLLIHITNIVLGS